MLAQSCSNIGSLLFALNSIKKEAGNALQMECSPTTESANCNIGRDELEESRFNG